MLGFWSSSHTYYCHFITRSILFFKLFDVAYLPHVASVFAATPFQCFKVQTLNHKNQIMCLILEQKTQPQYSQIYQYLFRLILCDTFNFTQYLKKEKIEIYNFKYFCGCKLF